MHCHDFLRRRIYEQCGLPHDRDFFKLDAHQIDPALKDKVGLVGIAHIFFFADRVQFELLVPRENIAPCTEVLASLHGHIVRIEIQRRERP